MRATRSTSARRPNCRSARANFADATLLVPKISRPNSMTIASESSRPFVSLRCLMTSMISGEIPSLSASGSCAAHSNRLSSSRAVVRMGQLANASSQPRLLSQIAVERPGMSRELRTKAGYRRVPSDPRSSRPWGWRGCHRSAAPHRPAARDPAAAACTQTLDRHPQDTWPPPSQSAPTTPGRNMASEITVFSRAPAVRDTLRV
jgi:hypothetical protein